MKKIIIILLFCLFARNAWATTKVTIQDSPSQIYPNQEFNVVFNIINDFISSDSYYVKGRIGSASASLNKGETYNSTTSSWLSDTSSWSSFPIINFNNDTIATASVKLRANQTVSIGNNLLVVRVNKNGNYDSSPSALLVIEPTPTIMPIIIPTIGAEDPSPTESPSIIIPTPQSYNNIYISEVMVYPVISEKEWVEIYNNNGFSVSLNNWYIDDLENGGSSPKIFSLEINAKGYGVFDFASSIFNNDGDSVRLLDFNKNLKDDFEYVKTEQGKSLGRTSLESDDFCLQEPSKNSANNSCINPAPTPIASVKTGQKNLSPTSTNFDVSIHRSINYSTGGVLKNYDNGDILGITLTTINNNLLLIRCLTFISFSYSLLTIISILFKMKLSYGKNKKLYSSPLHSS